MRHKTRRSSKASHATFVELLRRRAMSHPDRRCFTFLVDGDRQEEHLDYGDLDRKARAIAAVLRQEGGAGQRVLLLFPSGLEYIAAFFGCLYAGAVAVPAYPPRRNRSMERIRAIVTDAQPQIGLTLGSQVGELRRFCAEDSALAEMRWLASDAIGEELAAIWEEPSVEPQSLAFLQYTSGSTGTPRGVMVSHENLLANQGLIEEAFGEAEATFGVGWLPLYHDMGLIGNVLQTVYLGTRSVLMSPVAFLQKPVRWLEAISRYRATVSGGPNFAYDLCVHEIAPEQREGLDLSSWRVAFNGAEPIRAATLDRFCQTYAPYGFRREAFHPCYGLAEATLIVTGGRAPSPLVQAVEAVALEQNRVVPIRPINGEARHLVGCGRNLDGQTIRIVDPETHQPSPVGRIGEVWVSGPCMARGYWNRPDESAETFQARLGDGQGPFLRTGDLGFLDQGQLFITGRRKDLIIIRGCNHYPQDIELSVEQSHEALRPGGGAAFAVDIDGDEQLVVVQEVRRMAVRDLPVEEVASAIRAAVSERHDLQIYGIVFVKPGGVPKTSSGKIQRHACRAAYLAGELPVVARWQQPQKVNGHDSTAGAFSLQCAALSQEAIQQWLAARLAERLKLNPADIDVEKRFSRYGLDSVEAVCLTTALQEELGRPLSPLVVFEHPTIQALASHLREMLTAEAGK